MTYRTSRTLLLSAVVILTIVGALTASAQGPVHHHWQVVGGDSWTCDNNGDGVSDYQIDGQYWANINTWELSGDQFKVSVVFHGQITNPLTGETLQDDYATTDVYDFTDLTAVTDVWTGNIRHMFIPGEGPISSNAGRLVLLFDATDPNYWVLTDILFAAGHFPILSVGVDYCAEVGDGVFLEWLGNYEEVTKDLQ